MRKPNKNMRLVHCRYSEVGGKEWEYDVRSMSTCNYISKSSIKSVTKSSLYSSWYNTHFSTTIDNASCSSKAGK